MSGIYEHEGQELYGDGREVEAAHPQPDAAPTSQLACGQGGCGYVATDAGKLVSHYRDAHDIPAIVIEVDLRGHSSKAEQAAHNRLIEGSSPSGPTVTPQPSIPVVRTAEEPTVIVSMGFDDEEMERFELRLGNLAVATWVFKEYAEARKRDFDRAIRAYAAQFPMPILGDWPASEKWCVHTEWPGIQPDRVPPNIRVVSRDTMFRFANDYLEDYLRVYAAQFPQAEQLPCGHPKSLQICSVESDYKFCELCEAKSERHDALTMEARYKEQVEQLQKRVEELEQWKREGMGALAKWDYSVTNFLQAHFDVKEWGGTWQQAVLARLTRAEFAERRIRESDAAIVRLRDDLRLSNEHHELTRAALRGTGKRAEFTGRRVRELEQALQRVQTAEDVQNNNRESAERKLTALQRAVYDLTPGGSEFYNDDERCLEFIKAQRNQVIRFAGERNEAQRKLADAVRTLRGHEWGGDPVLVALLARMEEKK